MTVPPSVSPPAAADAQPFSVQLEGFSGPLELLLHLIREQEIDIYDIPIAQIADQFLAAIDRLGLNEAADFLEMAAYLVRVKIQMLLPRPIDEGEWEDPRAELVRRLLEYEQFREVAVWLAERAREHGDRFPRGWLPELPEVPRPPLVCSVQELIEAAERVLEAMPQPVTHRVVPRPLDVEGATGRVTEYIEKREEFEFAELLDETSNLADVLSLLLALLELARLGRLRVRQARSYGPLVITREPTDAAA